MFNHPPQYLCYETSRLPPFSVCPMNMDRYVTHEAENVFMHKLVIPLPPVIDSI